MKGQPSNHASFCQLSDNRHLAKQNSPHVSCHEQWRALASPHLSKHPFGSPKFCHAWTVRFPSCISSHAQSHRHVQDLGRSCPMRMEGPKFVWRWRRRLNEKTWNIGFSIDFPVIFLVLYYYTRLPIGITIYLHVFRYIYIHTFFVISVNIYIYLTPSLFAKNGKVTDERRSLNSFRMLLYIVYLRIVDCISSVCQAWGK